MEAADSVGPHFGKHVVLGSSIKLCIILCISMWKKIKDMLEKFRKKYDKNTSTYKKYIETFGK